MRLGSSTTFFHSDGFCWNSTTALASSLVRVSVPAEPISEQKPITSSSVRRLLLPSSSVTSTWHSRLMRLSSGFARLCVNSSAQ